MGCTSYKHRTYVLPRRDSQSHKRIVEIDFLRGFDLILMMAIHLVLQWGSNSKGMFLWNSALGPEPGLVLGMRSLFDEVANLILGGSLYFLEFFFSGLFVFLCGISCTFSHSNALRSAQLGIVACLLTFLLELADRLFHVGAHIYLGILHVIAIALAVYAFIDYFFPQWQVTFGVAIFFVVLVGITEYYNVVNEVRYVSFPTTANQWGEYSLTLLGLRRTGSDYFSPLRICAILFLGATVGKLAYKERKSHWPSFIPTSWTKPFCFLGRHSLIVYLIHVPLVIILLGILLLSAGYTLNL